MIYTRRVKVSVIVAAGRDAVSLERCVRSLLEQKTAYEVEVILAGDVASVALPGVRTIEVSALNPAVRRNRGVSLSSGEILGFIDDDATASAEWIERGACLLESDPSIVAVGGPDPAPPDSTIAELFSDTLLAAPWIGSGVLCHVGPPGTREVRSPHDLALVNLFVRRSAFERAGGFDEEVGYIGEDSALLAELKTIGRLVYCGELVVYHRRRRFPTEYVAQRWRYRVKMGESLLEPRSLYRRNPRIWIFIAGVVLFSVLAVVVPAAGILLFLSYVVGTLMAGISATRLPARWWPLIPAAFMIHHATYFAGIVRGIVGGLLRRVLTPRGAMTGQR